jgi:hypothetical protein
VRSPDLVIMGLSCTDDYNSALSPITLRDGELYTGAGRGGVLPVRVRTPNFTRSLSHAHITNAFNTECVAGLRNF